MGTIGHDTEQIEPVRVVVHGLLKRTVAGAAPQMHPRASCNTVDVVICCYCTLA
jgi:hypothetical protein